MSPVLLTALVTALGGIGVTALTVFGARRVTRADSGLKTAQADEIRLRNTIQAADYVMTLAARNEELAGQVGKLTRRTEDQDDLLREVSAASREHAAWDRKMLDGYRAAIGAIESAGLAHNLPRLPDPPALRLPPPEQIGGDA